MQMWAAGSSAHMTAYRVHAGFTLLELLMVIVLVGVAAAAVVSSLPDQSARVLRVEASRLAAVLEAQRVHAISNEVTHVLIFKSHQLLVEKKNAPAAAVIWSSDAIAVLEPPRWVLGPEPFGVAASLRVASQENSEQTLRIGTDGVRSFVVQNTLSEWLE